MRKGTGAPRQENQILILYLGEKRLQCNWYFFSLKKKKDGYFYAWFGHADPAVRIFTHCRGA
jgi:hypothetical protein